MFFFFFFKKMFMFKYATILQRLCYCFFSYCFNLVWASWNSFVANKMTQKTAEKWNDKSIDENIMLGWVWHGLAWPGWAVIRQYTQAADPFILILISPLYTHLSYHCNLFICRFMQINLLLLFSVGFLIFLFLHWQNDDLQFTTNCTCKWLTLYISFLNIQQ